MNKGKSRRASKHKKSGKYSKTFSRSVKKNGMWRGKVVDKIVHDAYLSELRQKTKAVSANG